MSEDSSSSYSGTYYCPWTKTKDYTTYEKTYAFTHIAGTSGVVTIRRTYQRAVDVVTYECTISDDVDVCPTGPGPSGEDWYIEQRTFDRELTVPLSKRASTTYTRRGTWTLVRTETF